jgi:hypothetical protein
MAGKELCHIATMYISSRKGLFSMFVFHHHWRVTEVVPAYSQPLQQYLPARYKYRVIFIAFIPRLYLHSITTPNLSYQIPGSLTPAST